jgi:hypothetical protein
VRTARSLLGYKKVLVEVDDAVWTGICVHAGTAASTFNRIYNDKAVGSTINGFCGAGVNTRSIFTMLAGSKHIGYLYMCVSPPLCLNHLAPEMPGVRLRFGIRSPIVTAMFIFAADLATIATVTL